jgi:signal transduction histidine kinase/CheY-like chemotaxis protein
VSDEVEAQELETLGRRARGLATLLEVSSSLAATLDLDVVLQATTDGVTRLFGFDTSAVYLLEGERLRLGATTPPAPPDFPEALRFAPLADHPHIARAIASGGPVLVPDARDEAWSPAERAVVEARDMRTLLYAPMVAGVKRVGIFIAASSVTPRPVTDVELDLCRALANLAALTTENARLYRARREDAAALELQVAETRRSEAERLELERRLLHAQKLESLGVLAGGIAHDFNNLLQAILGHLDLARRELPPGSPAREGVEQSAAAARRATDLTRQLLAYSGKGRFLVQALDLSALVRENAHLFRASVPRTCTLELRLEPGLPPVEADVGQLQQVVMNLITNAADAIGAGVGTITISTGLRRNRPGLLAGSRIEEVPPADDFVALEVADTGCGMDAPTLERLFDPFFTTKGPGRGLGMSALLGIVRGHRGALFVESAPGAGTRVSVLFPALPASRRPAAERAAGTPSPTAAPLSGTALVVDDEELVRRACRSMLRSLGLDVLTAAGGREAVELVRSRPGAVRFVVLDLTMPELDGLETLEALRAVDPGLKVILSSGFDEQESLRRAAGSGLDGFIQKPYTLAQLREALEAAARLGLPRGVG